MSTKSNTPKIISGIVVAMSLISVAFFFLPSFWFWVVFESSAAMLVSYGCLGEWYLHHHPAGRKQLEKDEYHKKESRFILCVALGVTMELFSLGHNIREAAKLQNEVAAANERAATTESNVIVLNKATLELAQKYDLSTNALAEARARIASLSAEVAMASPSNFPISSVEGNGYIVISTNDSAKVLGLEWKPIVMELFPEMPGGGVNPDAQMGVLVHGKIWHEFTNRLGNIELSFDCDEANVRMGGSPPVTFNSVHFARLDILPRGARQADFVGVEDGILSLRFNSSFDFSADFMFPRQTNHMRQIMAVRMKWP